MGIALKAATPHWRRLALLGVLGMAVVVGLVLFAYELALARIPQHRAALERIVRAQTGLDIRFGELGLRWGWYGPEAVFRQVELDEPQSAAVLLRAPELVVGFDAWRTLRSGHPEAGRIELLAPEIDLSSPRERPSAIAARGSGTAAASVLGRVAVLQGWRGGRIDIEGGTLHLPDRGGNTNLLTVHIQQLALRRSAAQWSVAGLVYLPDRVGRSARLTLRLAGNLNEPAGLAGVLRIEAHRLMFPGCRDFLAGIPDLARYLPRGGGGDVTAEVSFARGQIHRASGSVHAGGLVFDALPGSSSLLSLGRLHSEWSARRHGSDWRIQLDSLDLMKGERPATLALDTGESAGAQTPGRWIRGSLGRVPLEAIIGVARWLAPHFDLAGVRLEGMARNLVFDWAAGRPDGQRLRTHGNLENIALIPQSRDFTLSGLEAQLSGSESQLRVEVESRTARLELAQSQQQPLAEVHVASVLYLSKGSEGWRIATDGFLLEHRRATLRLSGRLQDDPVEPRIVASGTLIGADIPLVARLLGENTAQAFGAAASRLTAGRIQNAEFDLQGPISRLPFDGDGFSGSLTLRDAVLSGGDLWPDAGAVEARVEWHGARIQATIDSGRAGPFQLANATAQWSADGSGATRLTGRVNGRLEDAIAWVRDHPRLQEYAPDVGEISARGDAGFDLNVLVPVDPDTRPAHVSVSTSVKGATVQAIAGLSPLEDVEGSFAFESGHLQKSTLTGSWLGGPVTLRLGERRSRGARSLAVQAQGTLQAQHLAALANAAGTAAGDTDWSGELICVLADGSRVGRWRMRADSNLLGVVSSLPEPFAKQAPVAVPVHLEISGTGDAAQVRATLGDRMRSLFALERGMDGGWTVRRGAVRLGSSIPVLPAEPVVLVLGHVAELDLPAYAFAWQRLRRDSLPAVRVQMAADELSVAGQHYPNVILRAERTETGTDLLVDSAAIAGVVRWPAGAGAGPAELHLTRLELPEDPLPPDGVGLIGALAPAAQLSVDELSWRGRRLGRLTGELSSAGKIAMVEDIRLVNGTQDTHGALRCHSAEPRCRLVFGLDSNDAAATLADFGFRANIAASTASLEGDVSWQPGEEDHRLRSLQGTLSLRLADGSLGGVDNEEAVRTPGASVFGLFAVPALVAALNAHGAAVASLASEPRELHFDRLEADFSVQDGQASTSNLHFDGDAEILMRGRTDLVARDYDQQVWVLRGEERLPAAIRHFGATPRVAAAWLSLRDLFTGDAAQGRSRTVLRLQGSWDDPTVRAD